MTGRVLLVELRRHRRLDNHDGTIHTPLPGSASFRGLCFAPTFREELPEDLPVLRRTPRPQIHFVQYYDEVLEVGGSVVECLRRQVGQVLQHFRRGKGRNEVGVARLERRGRSKKVDVDRFFEQRAYLAQIQHYPDFWVGPESHFLHVLKQPRDRVQRSHELPGKSFATLF